MSKAFNYYNSLYWKHADITKHPPCDYWSPLCNRERPHPQFFHRFPTNLSRPLWTVSLESRNFASWVMLYRTQKYSAIRILKWPLKEFSDTTILPCCSVMRRNLQKWRQTLICSLAICTKLEKGALTVTENPFYQNNIEAPLTIEAPPLTAVLTLTRFS